MTEKVEGFLSNDPIYRPIEPDWASLEMEKDLKGRGDKVHRLIGLYAGLKEYWRVAEKVGWNEGRKNKFEELLSGFQQELNSL